MPSSVSEGSRPPSSCLIFSYSSGVMPCSRTTSGVMTAVAAVVIMGNFYCRISEIEGGRGKIGESWVQDPALKSDLSRRSYGEKRMSQILKQLLKAIAD